MVEGPFHTVEVPCQTGDIVAALTGAVEAALLITRVVPEEVPESGGVDVTVFGANIRAGLTSVLFGRGALGESIVVTPDGTRLTGVAPAWAATGGRLTRVKGFGSRSACYKHPK